MSKARTIIRIALGGAGIAAMFVPTAFAAPGPLEGQCGAAPAASSAARAAYRTCAQGVLAQLGSVPAADTTAAGREAHFQAFVDALIASLNGPNDSAATVLKKVLPPGRVAQSPGPSIDGPATRLNVPSLIDKASTGATTAEVKAHRQGANQQVIGKCSSKAGLVRYWNGGVHPAAVGLASCTVPIGLVTVSSVLLRYSGGWYQDASSGNMLGGNISAGPAVAVSHNRCGSFQGVAEGYFVPAPPQNVQPPTYAASTLVSTWCN